MPKKILSWSCNACHAVFSDETEALRCEAKGHPPLIPVGAIVNMHMNLGHDQPMKVLAVVRSVSTRGHQLRVEAEASIFGFAFEIILFASMVSPDFTWGSLSGLGSNRAEPVVGQVPLLFLEFARNRCGPGVPLQVLRTTGFEPVEAFEETGAPV